MSIDISIIIPVFNKVDYLEECVVSALAQEAVRTQVICVDDASTDESWRRLDSLGRLHPELVLLRNAENLGAGPSRNRGIKAALGQFLRFVDADDVIPVDSSAALLNSARATGADLVRGSLEIFRDTGTRQVIQTIQVPNKPAVDFASEPSLWIPWWHTSYLISTDLVRRNQIRYPRLRRGEDPVFLASLLVSAKSISLIEQVVYWYRRYPKKTGSAGSTLADIVDTLVHARTVKQIYSPGHGECWTRGYGPFLWEDVRRVVGRSTLDGEDMAYVESEMQDVWD
jgi:CDP-glycerol glycerophosphotransferase